MIRPEVVRESLAVKEWLAEGRAEGRAKARLECLLQILEIRFPGIPVPPSAHTASDEVLKTLVEKAITARGTAAMRRAIKQATTQAPRAACK